jgi:carbon storage regulator CsrA
MLVLSRHENQEIVVRVPPSDVMTEIRIVVVRVATRFRKVRLGITAPKESCSIHRSEIQVKVDAEVEQESA